MTFHHVLLAQYILVAIAAMQPSAVSQVEDGILRGGTTIGQIILFLTTVGGFVYTLYRENRNRRWDLEDRERARAELAATVTKSQVTLAQEVQGQQLALMEKIDENTAVSVKAFHEANGAKSEIARLVKMFTEVKITAKEAASQSGQRLQQLEKDAKKENP